MDRDKIIEHYLLQSNQKGFEIDQIRKELEANNVPEDEIRLIVRKVDQQVQNHALNKTNRSRGMQLIIGGVILVVIGTIIFLVAQIGGIYLGESIVLLYGPIVGGGSMITTGYAFRKQEAEKKRKLQYRPRQPRANVFDDAG